MSIDFHVLMEALDHIRLINIIFDYMDLQRDTLLVLLNLNAAFDTVDHGILLRCLNTNFGIHEKALEWFSSYLLGRSQCSLFCGVKSDSFDLCFSVPP